MATKSVHKVEVDSSQFKAFYDLFKSYSAAVENMPEGWQKLNGEIDEAGKTMGGFVEMTDSSKEALALAATQAHIISDAVSGVTKGTREGVKAQKEFLGTLRGSSKTMKEMAGNARLLGTEIFGIGKYLMKIGVLGTGVAGLGGILSGLGVRDLERSAVSNQREARGIGVTNGQLQAFNTDFGRYADPGILNRMADAQSDMTKSVYAQMATGMSPQAVQTSSPDQLAIATMQRAHDWWKRTPAGMRNAQTLQTTGLNQFMSFEEVRRLGGMTDKEFSSAAGNYSKDSKNLNVSDRGVDAWYEFGRQLDLTGKSLKTDLTERLSELGPHLGDFVRVINEDGKKLIDEVLTPTNVKSIGDAITDLTKYLGSAKFKSDLNDFGQAISGLAADGKKLYDFIHSLFSDSDSSGKTGSGGSQHSLGHDLMYPEDAVKDGLSKRGVEQFSRVGNKILDALGVPSASAASMAQKSSYMSDLEQHDGLPKGLLDAVWNQESARGKKMLSPAGAKGDFGFMDGTAKQYGVDVNDFYSSAKGSGQMYSDLLKRYGGDIKKALAAYNWGMGNKNDPRLDADIAKNGTQWESKLPAETQSYIKKILSTLSQRQAVKLSVSVTNNTAARVAVSANAGAIS